MRRNRNRREFLDSLIKARKLNIDRREEFVVQPDKINNVVNTEKILDRTNPSRNPDTNLYQMPSPIARTYKSLLYREIPKQTIHTPIELKSFLPTDSYIPKLESPINTLHIIENPGLGGAQIMMAEIVTALNKYYPSYVKNSVCLLTKKENKVEYPLFSSYEFSIETVFIEYLHSYCISKKIDTVIQHRISVSTPLRDYLPDNVKYILVNHSYYDSPIMNNLNRFSGCNAIVTVCEFLNTKLYYPQTLHKSRQVVILNSVNPIDDITPYELDGDFITGRCQRLVPSKFKIDSIKWLDELQKTIPNHRHYIIGSNKKATQECKKSESCVSLGLITSKTEKYKYIKSFDFYLYETFQHEGASVSLLESLSCGVPVIAKPFGGTPEIIVSGINGFLVNNRDEFASILQKYASNQDLLEELKYSTIQDFLKRLHPKHMASKYMQLLEAVYKDKTL